MSFLWDGKRNTNTSSPFLFALEVLDILERTFQSRLIKRIKKELPGCMVLKTDPNYCQGLPDLLILYGDRWAALENKRSVSAKHQPNQDYYIQKMNGMSWARFVYPENEREVIYELRQALGAERDSCVSEP